MGAAIAKSNLCLGLQAVGSPSSGRHGRGNKTTGLPVYNAIVWQDTRTQEEICDELAQTVDMKMLPARSGRRWPHTSSGPKVRWIPITCPGRAQAEAGELLGWAPSTRGFCGTSPMVRCTRPT